MLVVHVYSQGLPVLPGPWEDTVAPPCLDAAGSLRLLGRISLGPLSFLKHRVNPEFAPRL